MKTRSRAAIFSVIIFSLVVPHVEASNETIGSKGILSEGLTLPNPNLNPLTGSGIGIGQVEGFRPGDPTQPNGMPLDTDADLLNPFVDPQEVFFAQVDDPFNPTSITSFSPTANGIKMPPNPNNFEINDHPIQVASVMISSETLPAGTPSTAGVANGAKLYSSGFIIADQGIEAATAQHVALANSGDIRAINFSFGEALDSGVEEGNSPLTQFIDWSAKQHNTLYVVGGTQFDDEGNPSEFPVPTDNFNGMTIGKSEKNATSGVYDRVSDGNDFSHLSTERTHIDLIAPGVGVLVGSGVDDRVTLDGTSFAAPHVTGTVALLQQYADFQIAAGATNWGGMATSVPEPGPTARRHEVMKAVLMNSADKLIDDGSVTVPGGLTIPPGGLLGMDRTVLKQDGVSTWFNSESWDDSVDSNFGGFFPLDTEMGAGHLNASRALEQFAPGEHEEFGVSGTTVPVIGWDYGTTSGDNDVNRYRFDQKIQRGRESFIDMAAAAW